jgi:hypothetical protein
LDPRVSQDHRVNLETLGKQEPQDLQGPEAYQVYQEKMVKLVKMVSQEQWAQLVPQASVDYLVCQESQAPRVTEVSTA